MHEFLWHLGRRKEVSLYSDYYNCLSPSKLRSCPPQFYKRLERRWYLAHCRHSEPEDPTVEDMQGAELASEVADRIRDPLRERLADARHLCDLKDAGKGLEFCEFFASINGALIFKDVFIFLIVFRTKFSALLRHTNH